MTIYLDFFLLGGNRRFWVLEGGKGDSSDDEDDVSIATEEFEEEQKLYTTGPVSNFGNI